MNAADPVAVDAAAVFTREQVRGAHAAARLSGRPVGCVLREQSGLDGADYVRALGATIGYAALSSDELQRRSPAFDIVPFAEALARQCVPLRDEAGRLTLVTADPFDDARRAWAEHRVAVPFEWQLAQAENISAWLAQHEASVHAMDSVLAATRVAAQADAEPDELSLASISGDTSPVTKLISSTIYDALKASASDIHLETVPDGLVIRYRIDGVLTEVGFVAGTATAEQALSRVKVMSELDIAERRIPQDGRFKVTVRGREVDFRVSVMPSIFGEDAVLRVLDRQALSAQLRGLRLDSLGFDDDSVAAMRRLCAEPYGMVLVTGPTGSGKTTTLYAAISEINDGRDKIITIEDPVEYQLPGVLQIPVNEKKGLTFALGLRSILRHDPDRIMVGEIRDTETAQIAVQSALTGHLVFTTVHANNVFDVIGRFMHMGVDPYSFVSALNGILAQRLVRVNCPHCVADDAVDGALLEASGIDAQDAGSMRFRAGCGCGHCRGTGFRGRKAIGEILRLNDEIRELIVAREPVRRIREAARRGGTRFLRDSAVDLVRRGESTLREINRVTFVA